MVRVETQSAVNSTASGAQCTPQSRTVPAISHDWPWRRGSACSRTSLGAASERPRARRTPDAPARPSGWRRKPNFTSRISRSSLETIPTANRCAPWRRPTRMVLPERRCAGEDDPHGRRVGAAAPRRLREHPRVSAQRAPALRMDPADDHRDRLARLAWAVTHGVERELQSDSHQRKHDGYRDHPRNPQSLPPHRADPPGTGATAQVPLQPAALGGVQHGLSASTAPSLP